MNVEAIKPDLMVHAKATAVAGQKTPSMGGAVGVHIGTVDHVDGKQWIKLTKADSKDGKHHWIPLAWVERVDAKAVYLKKTADEVKSGLINESPVTMQ